jgi:hypothetical protein
MFWSPLSRRSAWTDPDPDPVVTVVPATTSAEARAALAMAAAGELLGASDLAAIFRLGPSRFHQLAKRGAFDLFKTHPPIGPRCYSGVLVHRYVSGETVYEPSFGRKRHRAS